MSRLCEACGSRGGFTRVGFSGYFCRDCWTRETERQKDSRPPPSVLRDLYPSVLVSARNEHTGEWRTVHGTTSGVRSLLVALQSAIAKLERDPGPWVVESISWPARILQDVRQDYARHHHAARFPEETLLGRIGRPDLIHRRGRDPDKVH